MDTTTEAVERLSRCLIRMPRTHMDLAAATLRALAAERDALVKDVNALRPLSLQCARLTAERDAARAEMERLRRGWLTTIQTENSCPATGGGCFAKRCGCLAEMEMLLREHDERAALAAKENEQ